MIMTSNAQMSHANDRVLNLTSHTTPNGIEFWHVEDHNLPITTLHFAFRGAGAVNDPDNKIGLGQLLSNTLDEGAGERDALEFQKILQDHAIDLSFVNNRDHFSGKIRTLKRHQNLAFSLLKDAIHNPLFKDEAVNRMREANIARIKSSVAKPNWIASRLMNDQLFGNHPYARNSGGTISGLEAITANDFRNYIERIFTKDRLVVSTAGDMSANEASQIIDDVFGDLPEKSDLASVANISYGDDHKMIGFEISSPQSVVQMAWPGIEKNDPDHHAVQVMNHILGGGGFSSLLMEEVREKRGLTYGIYSYPVNMDKGDYMMIESAMAPENITPMIEVLNDILDQLKLGDIDADQLDDAKNYLIGSLPMRFASTLSLSGTGLRMQLDGRHMNALDEWSEKINAVSVDDIVRVAKRIFANNKPSVTVIAGAMPTDIELTKIENIPGVE